jgi:hypothetical protein
VISWVKPAIGWSITDLTNAKVKTYPDSPKYPITCANRTGFGLQTTLKSDIVDDPTIQTFFSHLCSLTLNYGTSSENDGRYNPWGRGIEIGLLDMFYLREGTFINQTGEVTGNTHGYGIRLHYKDIVAFEMNQAVFPGGPLQYRAKSTDWGLSLDFLKLVAEMQ